MSYNLDMNTCSCNNNNNNNANSPAALSINNSCDNYVLFHHVNIPAGVGDETTMPPQNGLYRNVILEYEASGNAYLFSSDGIFIKIKDQALLESMQERISNNTLKISQEEQARIKEIARVEAKIAATTPVIGENGNWYINGEDTGISSKGTNATINGMNTVELLGGRSISLKEGDGTITIDSDALSEVDDEVSAYSENPVSNLAIKRYVDSHANTATVSGNPAVLVNCTNNDLVDYKILSNPTTKTGSFAPFSFDYTIIDSITINDDPAIVFNTPLLMAAIDESKDTLMLINKIWGIARAVGEYVFTGDEAWIGVKSNSGFVRGHAIVGKSTGSGNSQNSLSSHCEDTDFTSLSKLTGKAMATWQEDDGTSRVDVCLPISELTSADEAGIKAWFKAQADAGTPVSVLYKQEPVFEPIPVEDQLLLRTLYSASPSTTITTQAPQIITYFVKGADSIVVDTEMSDLSQNAVQNKTIKQYVDGLVTMSTVDPGEGAPIEKGKLYGVFR